MTLTTTTSKYITREIRELVKKEGLNGANVLKRVAQLRKQGYIVVTNKNHNSGRGWAWRVYELDS